MWELHPISEEGRPSCVYCSVLGSKRVFYDENNVIMYEGQKFLPVVRVCPCVEGKHLHIFYGYIPAVEEREDTVTETPFVTLCIILL